MHLEIRFHWQPSFFLWTILLCGASASGEEYYTKGWVGGLKIHDTLKKVHVKYHTGFCGGITLGALFSSTYGLEVEGLYLQNRIKDLRYEKISTGLKGKLTCHSLLVNLLIYFPLHCRLKFYGGLGAGSCREVCEVHAKGLKKHTDKEFRIAYQFLGGIAFPIYVYHSTKEISLTFDARYLSFDKHVRAVLLTAGLQQKF